MAIRRHPGFGRAPGPHPGPGGAARAPHSTGADLAGQDITGAVDRLHAAVEEAFGEFERAEGGRGTQYRAVLRISEAMAAHTTVEQELVYPALRDLTGRHQPTVDRHLEQQHLMDVLLVELAAMVPGERRFEAKVRLLGDLFRQHVGEQEEAILPELDTRLDLGERRRLAADVGAYARELRKAS